MRREIKTKSRSKRTRGILIFLLIFVLLTCSAGFSGCSAQIDPEAPADQATIDIFRDYRSILSIPRSGYRYPDEINTFIVKRLEAIGISYRIDQSDNIIADIPASEGFADLPATVLQCHTGDRLTASKNVLFKNWRDGVLPLIRSDGTISANGRSMGASGAAGIANVLYILSAAPPHGPIRILFTVGAAEDTENFGAAFLSPEDIQPANASVLISFDGTQTDRIGIGSKYAVVMESKTTLSVVPTQNKRAFIIAASGFSGGNASPNSNTPENNPYLAITNILAMSRSMGIQYELSRISAGTEIKPDPHAIPTEATAVVVLNDYEERKFREYFSSVIKTLQRDAEDTREFAMIETIVPPSVVSNDDANRIITYISGLFSIRFTGEETSAALIPSIISLDNALLHCETCVLGDNMASNDKIIQDLFSLERLTGIRLREILQIPGFQTDPGTKAVLSVFESAATHLGSTPESYITGTVSELGYISKLVPDLPILSVGITIQTKDSPAESIKTEDLAVPAGIVLSYLKSQSESK